VKKALLALAIVLAFAATLPGDTSAHTKYISWSSYGFSSGSEQATFSSSTYASGPTDRLWVAAKLQYFDWSCTCWRNLFALGAESCEDCTLIKTGGTVTIQRYGGINCRRVRGVHGGYHGNSTVGNSFSGAVCK